MDGLWFVIKVFIFTIAFIFVSQLHVGQTTIEDRMHAWIQTSNATGFLQGVADGGVVLTSRAWSSAKHWINLKLDREEPKRHSRRPQGVPESRRQVEDVEEDTIE